MAVVLMSSFSRSLTPTASSSPPVASKNWNPGNYIASTTTDNDSIWDIVGTSKTQGILQRLNSTNDPDGHWKGALLRFQWTDLERNEGEYSWDDPAFPGVAAKQLGMAKVERYLNQMAAFPGRRLIIFIQIKTSGDPNGTSPPHAVPSYMRSSATYYGDGANNYTYTNSSGVFTQGSQNGQYAYVSSNGGPGGFIPNMHNTAVKNRFVALMQAFADRFNTNPYLEAICFSEASIASPAGAPSNWNTLTGGGATWYDNMTLGFTSARTALSNVQIAQWINAARSDMKTWVPELRAAGIGLGMPDLCPEEQGFNFRNDIPGQASASPGNIQHLQDSAGTAIIMGHASRPSLNGTVVGRSQQSGTIQGQAHVYPTYPGLGTSRQDLHDFAVNTVGVTHLLWAHNTGSQQATGSRDPAAPGPGDPLPWADTYTAYSNYGGQGHNTVTDAWIHNVGSTITTVETRPTGWT